MRGYTMLVVYNISGRINNKYWLSYLSLIWLCHNVKASYLSSPSKQMLSLLGSLRNLKQACMKYLNFLSTTYLSTFIIFLLPFSLFVEQNRLFFLRLKANTLLCTLYPISSCLPEDQLHQLVFPSFILSLPSSLAHFFIVYPCLYTTSPSVYLMINFLLSYLFTGH